MGCGGKLQSLALHALPPAHQPAIDHCPAVHNRRAIDWGVSDERLVWAFNGILSAVNWRISLNSSNGRFLCTMFKLIQKIPSLSPAAAHL
jgi:hypothetical protein